jgi:O-acetyl-ADP-ribose deacetylase (regulator of RNase III)
MSLIAEKCDLTKINCEAIVNPANSYGYMGGGIAGAIKKFGGIEIEQAAIMKAPIPVGNAIYTTAGKLPSKYIIHAPTMEKPAMKTNIINIKNALEAAFKIALKLNIKSIAIPGMGTGVGGVSHNDAAQIIVEISMKYKNQINKTVLFDKNNLMISAFNKFL